MDVTLYLAGIFAFAPTLILMYAVLRKYTYPAVEQPFFSDPSLFGLFVVGLIAGTALFAVYTYLSWVNIIYMVLFAVIECLIMVMILNLKRFHGKSDTVFYGYGLGLGVGCTMAFGTIFYLGTAVIGIDEGASIDLAGAIWLFVIALSQILLLSAVGTTVGEGIARLRPMEYAMQAILVTVIFNLMLAISYSNTEGFMFYVLLFLAFAIAVAYFHYIMYAKLSRVIRDVLKMEGKTRKDVPK